MANFPNQGHVPNVPGRILRIRRPSAASALHRFLSSDVSAHSLKRRARSLSSSLSLSVPFSSLCTAYEPRVANLCAVVCGHHSRSAGGTTASAAGRSASSQPVSAGQVNRRQMTHGICIPGRVTDKFLISLPIFIVA